MKQAGRGNSERDGERNDDPLIRDAPDLMNLGLTARSLEEAARIRAEVRRINAEVNERSGRNLVSAVAVGVLLAAAVLVSLLIDKQWFIVFGVGMVVMLVIELATAMHHVGMRVPRVPSTIAVILAVPAAFYGGAVWLWGAVLAGTAFVLLWRLVVWFFQRPRRSRRQLAIDCSAIIFVQIYVTFIGSFTALLVAQPNGQFWAIAFILIVVCVDTGAYATGMKFGRTKLAPQISPGKTWEGTIGGALIATAAAVLLCIFLLGIPWWIGLILGISITITATAGDLTESMIKRALGVKDMSNWLPGHGGFFDRFDSVLPSGAMAFALYFWAAPLMY